MAGRVPHRAGELALELYVNLPIGIVALAVIWRLLPTVKRPDASRNLDIPGAAVFTVAVGALLIGLTNKQTADWAAFEVGGLILIGLALGAVFVLIESRAKEPIVPLDLWKDRTYAASIAATFLISFGFFGAAVFLPQWFQFVQGATPTNSGLYSLALLAGMILSSVGAGILVSRTGRYKAIVLGGIAIMTVGLLLMTNLRADTPLPLLWAWMFVTGFGIGPTLSVFTIIVQKRGADPFARRRDVEPDVFPGSALGRPRAAGHRVRQPHGRGDPRPARDRRRPAAVRGPFRGRRRRCHKLIVVGQDLGQTSWPGPGGRPAVVEPLIPNIVFGIHQSFSLAISEVFMIGVVMTAVGLVAAGS